MKTIYCNVQHTQIQIRARAPHMLTANNLSYHLTLVKTNDWNKQSQHRDEPRFETTNEHFIIKIFIGRFAGRSSDAFSFVMTQLCLVHISKSARYAFRIQFFFFFRCCVHTYYFNNTSDADNLQYGEAGVSRGITRAWCVLDTNETTNNNHQSYKHTYKYIYECVTVIWFIKIEDDAWNWILV